ncbi:hypothetical protein D1164_00595 [Mariniphaga sediminis]|uniref:Uncharacterized protein n=1 Tax=Mariniphaga sediminis TaxID=1628158 RepID=A0A399D4X7_9BACT|nr:hypothetical protein [Mariniphaga sediminis]RIH66964.1 hypothetical protein D1164_00595 [Mariniphaga sediminis]
MKQLFTIGLFIIVAALLSTHCSYKTKTESGNAVAFGDSIYMQSLPPQPDETAWKFIDELKAPMWTEHEWESKLPASGQADLSGGVILKKEFPDPKGYLETAYEDLRLFLAAGDVPTGSGEYLIEFLSSSDLTGEAFRLEVNASNCRLWAGDVEGIRRGIFYLEDEMLRLRAPFLPLGTMEKEPAIKSRISRCFFGPIKRPPAMRDELMDAVDYYPDNYLNRLAHEGVNGLWLTIEFRDLVSTRFTPDNGKDAEQRLKKLSRTVEKCLRYGIKTYIFCIEPRAWEANDPVLTDFPELGGHKSGNRSFFCPLGKEADEYLYESVNKIFKAVPELGGIINITHGERATTCLSAVSSFSDHTGRINCPRCSDKEPWEILYASLSSMQRGMHDVNPDAELISWLYMPQPQRFHPGDVYKLGNWVYDLPVHTPKGVVLQFNFESGVEMEVFGKKLVGGDYWISKPGPSDRFEDIARIAREHDTRMSAKIQTGNSHELATVPFVPVPSLLYEKFAAMQNLGVTHTMLCWYFGNYPGLMNKAAGELSMKPFPENETEFLGQLASVYWKNEDVPKVVEAWKHFSSGYENYPLTNHFQYYGPMHDGPVWPLLLKPADAPLAPTWQIGSSTTLKPWPPSGDRVGECIGGVLTLEEVVELCRRMTTSWDKGVEIFKEMEMNYLGERERMLDIGVAKALGIQFRSGYNILNFYLLREKMLRMEGMERLEILNQLTDIIEEEIALDEQLLALCKEDSRLGFHSEAEGYKYFPEKIEWRMAELKKVLENDVPAFEKIIKKGELLFPEYTGKRPEGAIANCIQISDVSPDATIQVPSGLQWQELNEGADTAQLQWASARDSEALYVWVTDKTPSNQASLENPVSNVRIKVEPGRLYPAFHFSFHKMTEENAGDPVRNLGYSLVYTAGFREVEAEGQKYVVARIPFRILRTEPAKNKPLRVDVIVQKSGEGKCSWRPDNPLTPRLILGNDNPADLGWLIFN